MPIKDRDDAVEVEDRIRRIFEAAPRERDAGIRALFVEVLDFDAAAGRVDLAGAPECTSFTSHWRRRGQTGCARARRSWRPS